MRTKVTLLLAVVLGAVLPLQAGPVLPDVWYEFSFTAAGVPAQGCSPADPAGLGCTASSGTPTVFADAPPWTFTSGLDVFFTVTDAFSSGDAFTIFDFDVPIGMTPSVATGANCGSDPVVCLADPAMSHAVFLLAAGNHSITITPHESPFGAGAAYFTWQAVPEPSTWLLIGSGLLAVGLIRRRSRA